jgi:hypothetical protein
VATAFGTCFPAYPLRAGKIAEVVALVHGKHLSQRR